MRGARAAPRDDRGRRLAARRGGEDDVDVGAGGLEVGLGRDRPRQVRPVRERERGGGRVGAAEQCAEARRGRGRARAQTRRGVGRGRHDDVERAPRPPAVRGGVEQPRARAAPGALAPRDDDGRGAGPRRLAAQLRGAESRPGGVARPSQRHLSGVDDDGARAVDMVPGSLLVMAVVDSLGARDEAEEGEQAALRHLRSRIELSAAAPPGQKADVPQYGIVWYDIRYRYKVPVRCIYDYLRWSFFKPPPRPISMPYRGYRA